MSSQIVVYRTIYPSEHGLRMCSYAGDDLREREMIDLGWLEGDIYVVLFYGFGSDNGVDLSGRRDLV